MRTSPARLLILPGLLFLGLAPTAPWLLSDSAAAIDSPLQELRQVPACPRVSPGLMCDVTMRFPTEDRRMALLRAETLHNSIGQTQRLEATRLSVVLDPQDAEAPTVRADWGLYDSHSRTVDLAGNVVATRGTRRVEAPQARVALADGGGVNRIDASGGVTMQDGSGLVVNAQKASYRPAAGELALTGQVVAQQGARRVTAPRARVMLDALGEIARIDAWGGVAMQDGTGLSAAADAAIYRTSLDWVELRRSVAIHDSAGTIIQSDEAIYFLAPRRLVVRANPVVTLPNGTRSRLRAEARFDVGPTGIVSPSRAGAPER